MNKTAAFAIAVLFTLLSNSCSYPNKEYAYHEFDIHNGWDTEDTIKFELDICDTINPLEMDIIGYIKTDSYINSIGGYPINILFYTPDKEVYADTLTLPIKVGKSENIKMHGNSSIEILWNYRKNIINNKPGKWHIEFLKAKQDSVIYKNIIGIGISVTEYER